MIALKGIILFVVFLSTSVRVFGTWLAGQTVQGWTSVMLLFLLIASFQTLAIAVIGEYVGKIYFETKDTGFAKWLFACERVIGYCTGARSWKARSNKSR
jgi:type IV secretory pathway VirB3-like protein